MNKAVALLITLFALSAAADVANAQDGTRFGLGVGMTDFDFASSTVYVPITMRNVRIEPMLAFSRTAREEGTVDISVSNIRLGSGIFALSRTGDNLIYYGGRIGVNSRSVDVEGDDVFDDDSETDIFIAPATGMEHFFGDAFSLGGEVQLVYTQFDDEGGGDDVSSFRTNTVFFVRWHL